MKKLFTLIGLLSSAVLFGQTSKWFITVAAAPTMGGPSAGIKKNMQRSGFDHLTSYSFFGWTGSTQYPVVEKNPAVLVTVGKKVNEFKSLYITGGVAASGTVSGFRSYGSYDYLLWSGEMGNSVKIAYSLWQLSAGYQYRLPGTRAKLGFGPDLFVFRYCEQEEEQNHAAILPGVSGQLRLPLGRERRRLGLELFLEAQVGPPARTRAYSKTYEADGRTYTTVLEKGNASVTQLLAGLSFAFRDPARKTN
jgi:hypothetical protein